MGEKASHRQARETVAAHHRAALTDLAQHVVNAADEFRAGALDVTAFDRVIHQYHRATQELWTFCNIGIRTSSTGASRSIGGNGERRKTPDPTSRLRAEP